MESSSDYSAEKPLIYKPVSQHDGTDSSSVEDLDDNETLLYRGGRRWWKSYLKWAAVIALCLFLYSLGIITVSVNITNKSRRIGQRFLKSPVDPEYIVYEPYVMTEWEYLSDSPERYFSAEPNEEVDKNWHELLGNQNLGIDANFMKEIGRENEGIELPDGTYFGSIMVFHNLHCLKNIYHALNPEYYGVDNLTPEKKAIWKNHTSHCLLMIKQAIMCQGDTTPITMKWADHRIRPIGNLTAPHECVNWDRLMEWVLPNSRDLSQEGWLVHPDRGPVITGDGELGEDVIS